MHEAIDDAGGWWCRHEQGAARLRSEDAVAGRLLCPECGMEWRCWPAARVAKPVIEGRPSPTGALRVLDIDRVVAAVRAAAPDVVIRAWEQPHAADDDGLWRFSRGDRSVQIESSTGGVPFLVETDDGARDGGAVEDVVAAILAAL